MNTSTTQRPTMLGSAFALGRDAHALTLPGPTHPGESPPENGAGTSDRTTPTIAPELYKSLAAVKGQAQFLLYLADQIEESLDQLAYESEACQGAFLCKILGMYSAQLESKHQGLGDKIAETCQEVYVTIREFDAPV